jgi:hypothetical protein
MENGWVWEDLLSIVGVFVTLTIVLTVGIRQFASLRRAQLAAGHEQALGKLTESAMGLQESTENHLREIALHLADISGRVAALERILKEVE